MLESISVNELDSGTSIIDIRSIEKYNDNHIPGAINIPLKNLLMNPSKYLNKSKLYYIYCQRGIQSRKLCLMLKNMGYKVVNIHGGYEAWVLEQ